MTIEYRTTASPATVPQIRGTGAGQTITGYAAVFYNAKDPGTEYQLAPGITEHISPLAFSRALREKHDVRALFNHDPNFPLGRLPAGTLKLFVDAKGLRYEITPPDAQIGKDVLAFIKRGDVTGSSFAFIARKVAWIDGNAEEGSTRIVEDLDLVDVSPVTFPAYSAATAQTK